MQPQLRPTPIQYYIGVQGEQVGPFSEAQMFAKIDAHEIPPDTLIWFEGLGGWQPLVSIESFRARIEKNISAVPPPPPPISAPSSESVMSFADGSAEPLFKDESTPEKTPHQKKKIIIGASIGGAILVGGLVYFLFFMGENIDLTQIGKKAKSGEGVKSREEKVRTALSELLLNPDASLQVLREVLKEKNNDAIGKEALEALLNYYKQRQRYVDAGRFLVELKRPSEAVKFFLMDNNSTKEAEVALYEAYQGTKEAFRKDFLLQDIQLLIGPLKNEPLAIERIKLLEKEFPGTDHPYHFYVLDQTQKIEKLFEKLNAYFVQTLTSYLNAELPEIRWATLPKLELVKEPVKEGKDNQYRITGRYKGDLQLNRDTLKNLHFLFWFYNDQWLLVDTNLTAERAKFSAEEKKRHQGELYPPGKILDLLETTFRTQYPKHAFHEDVSQIKKQAPIE